MDETTAGRNARARTWPEDWDNRRGGLGCPACAQGRPADTKGGRRFFEGRYADAYLRTQGPLRALQTVFEPAQINYSIFGNSVPHVHTYLLPRHVNDPSPGSPLNPFIEVPVPEKKLAEQLDRLRAAVRST